jgi:hypothetical protein
MYYRYREQWEAKVASAATLKGGMVSAAANAVLHGSTILNDIGKPLTGGNLSNSKMGGSVDSSSSSKKTSSSLPSHLLVENRNPLSDSLSRSRSRIDREFFAKQGSSSSSSSSADMGGGSGDVGGGDSIVMSTPSPLHEYDDGYSIGSLIVANTAFLANEWQVIEGIYVYVFRYYNKRNSSKRLISLSMFFPPCHLHFRNGVCVYICVYMCVFLNINCKLIM